MWARQPIGSSLAFFLDRAKDIFMF